MQATMATFLGLPGGVGMMRLDVCGEFGLDLVKMGANRLDQRLDPFPSDGMAATNRLVCITVGRQ